MWKELVRRSATYHHDDDDDDEKNLAFCCALVFKYKAFFKRTTCNIVILGPQKKEKGRGKRKGEKRKEKKGGEREEKGCREYEKIELHSFEGSV